MFPSSVSSTLAPQAVAFFWGTDQDNKDNQYL